jgi:hypothetical protein
MSVTFSIVNGPTKINTYECCTWEGCPSCKGSNTVSFEVSEPSLNLANMNAMAILRTVGLETDYCGEVAAEDVPNALRKILLARNTSRVNNEVRDTEVTHGGRCVSHGIDAEYVVDRLDRLAEIFRLAAELQSSVVWY